MKEKLREFLRPRLALMLAVALLAAYLPAMPATQAAGDAPTSAWEEQEGVKDSHFDGTGTKLDSYTYYRGDGTTKTVTVDHSATLGSRENPFSIPDEKALILFGKLEKKDTKETYYILDKPDGEYNMGAHTMLPLMGIYTSNSKMSTEQNPFQGVLIGNHASIENVYIKWPNTTENNTTPGLFGILDGAEVMDLAVSLTYFDQKYVSEFSVGGIAANTVEGGAALVNLRAKVSAADEGGFGSVGGLVGSVDSENVTFTNCAAEVTGSLTASRRVGGLVGSVNRGGNVTFTNCTAEVAGSLTATKKNGFASADAGGLVGYVAGEATLTNCTAEVMGSLTATSNSSAANAGGLVGTVLPTGKAALTDCAAQAVITKPENGSYAPSGPVGSGTATFSGTNITTLRMGADSSVSLELVNNTALTLGDSGGILTATGNGTTGSVTVGSNGDAEIRVHGGDTTYTLTGVNGTLRLEDKPGETPPQYWVTADASFSSNDTDPLAKGDKVDLLGAAGNRLCTVTVEAGTGGSVDGGGTFDANANVTVTANPDSGYRFVGWTKNGQQVSTDASYAFNVTSSCTLTAVFTPQYTVTVQAGTGGSVNGGGTFDANTNVTVTAAPESGYRFVNWTENGKEVSAEASYTFEVTASRTLTAVFERRNTGGGGGGGYIPPSAPTYPPTVERPSEGGGAVPSVSPSRPEQGDTVTITTRPDEGFEVDEITVTDKDGKPVEVTQKPDGTYTFIQPTGKVKIEVSYKEVNTPWNNPFADVSENDWYYEAVRFVQERGLMNGYSDGRFGPNDTLSRAQLAQILFNKEDRPGVNYLIDFSDVAGEAWYTEAIRWAASQGIVGGYGNGRFGPNDPITREQLAVMLWRYVGSPAAANQELHFADADEISPFALESMRWAMENGILNGYGGGRLGPHGQATRAQVAQMLKNFIENQEENTMI